MRRLEGRSALVTGANSGIGKALALELARRGHAVIAGVRDPAKAAALIGEAAGEGHAIRAVRLDVTDPDSIQRAMADITAREGPPELLVNNAGVSANAPLELLPEDHHRLVFETNYWGSVRMMQAVAGDMRRHCRGRILNISSIMPRFVLAGTTAYAASKAALERASEALALEMAPFGVRVVVIEPGAVKSDLQANTSGGGRWADPAQTPYAPTFALTRRIQLQMLAQAMEADAAARVMLDAALADDPPFRLLVGEDANRFVPARETIADKDWIAMGAAGEAAFGALLRDRLGVTEG
ncbi:NAD(P)-dependent dehydrogenase (short-subunit alcohol dehydrogenase family) [Caulobacter ginsengisoli]|uniref:NAD(P)-dependent dehydrogenase (Short-subunit alcohol dehydrogenase family) n=1 Tax=Caulobacter ginsengisoli TaxID=400775 RepID=A0ABU0J011_9CAUL|nr:SDR family oxidoreductase [Caulobacter ginsengisoli]MDQ0466891.1 NAD(P)-dependent dehydrogenase (short-subunit alcohol dehydrogenase family) [Caulobacter ginsengisoli]